MIVAGAAIRCETGASPLRSGLPTAVQGSPANRAGRARSGQVSRSVVAELRVAEQITLRQCVAICERRPQPPTQAFGKRA